MAHAVTFLALAVAIVLLAGGVFVFVAILWRWEDVKEFYQGWWTKFGVAGARFVSACAGIGASVYGTSSPETYWWEAALGAAALSWLTWEAAQIVGETKLSASITEVKRALLAEKLRSKETDRQVSVRSSLIAILRKLVIDKVKRLQELPIQGARKGKAAPKLSQFLDPAKHMYDTLASLLPSMQSLHYDPTSTHALQANMRVGLYEPVPKDDPGGPGRIVLTPTVSYDSKTGRAAVFSSHLKYPQRFALDNATDPAHAVKCVNEQRTFIISDTVAAGIEFFDTSQGNYVCSLIAHPINGLRNSQGEQVTAALVIDCDVAGFFKDSDRRTLEFILNEFASRLVLESNLLAWKHLVDGGNGR